MTLTSTSKSSIFEDGKLKPGIYKIQNIYGGNYLDIEVYTREMYCRPANDLGEGGGLWEIKPFGAGHTIQRVEPGAPEQFCAAMVGLEHRTILSVSAYPVAWRIEVVNEDIHRGFDYVRFYWGTTNKVWETPNSGTKQVRLWTKEVPNSWFIWKLIPVEVEGLFTASQPPSETHGSGSPPSYSGDATGQSSTRAQHVESERDDFGTIVTEVTTITTRKRYRVEDA